MSYLIGILIGLACIQTSLVLLDQNVSMYIDDVALAMVLGGTISVGIISAPWHLAAQIRDTLLNIFIQKKPHTSKIIEECLSFCQTKKTVKDGAMEKTVGGQLLKDGEELLALNFSTDDIEIVLEERLHQYLDKRKTIADFFHSLSKYPPAFGLVGTVFGLINLMRAMADGMDPTQTGVKMALALVATLYGLLTANFIVAPIGEAISKGIEVERFNSEIALQAILLASENTSLLKSQELLNSFADREHRVDLISGMVDDLAA